MDIDAVFTLLGKAAPILTAASAFLGGLFGSRFTKRLDIRHQRKRLRNGLYAEVATNLQRLSNYHANLHDPTGKSLYPPIEQWLVTDVYQEAVKESVLFYELKEAQFISDFYLAFKYLKERPVAEQEKLFETINSWIKASVKRGLISRRKFNSHYSLKYLSPCRNPIEKWFTTWYERRYYRLLFRNVPKDGRSQNYLPIDTLFKITKALWKGTPEPDVKPSAVSSNSPNKNINECEGFSINCRTLNRLYILPPPTPPQP